MPQYTLPITLPPVFSEDNFHVAPCNQEAHAWAMRWPKWPAHAIIVYGPSGAGKSHLGHLWAARAKARFAGPALAPETMRGNFLIEDIERLRDERGLLHLLNLAKEHDTQLLLTSGAAPKQLPFTLPDLTSRLLALPAVGIEAPDDEALAAVLRKQFGDRQLRVDDSVIDYVLPRMDRTYKGATTLVSKLDAQALAEHRSLTVPFVRRTLGY